MVLFTSTNTNEFAKDTPQIKFSWSGAMKVSKTGKDTEPFRDIIKAEKVHNIISLKQTGLNLLYPSIALAI